MEEAFDAVKSQGAFSGSLRKNLTKMLDAIGIAATLGLVASEELFTGAAALCHPTSAVRYPVFDRGVNYRGHAPLLVRSPMLARYVDTLLRQELEASPEALVIPLGRAAESAVARLVERSRVSADRVLGGFPHPSGANAHRSDQFNAARTSMRAKVASWNALYGTPTRRPGDAPGEA